MPPDRRDFLFRAVVSGGLVGPMTALGCATAGRSSSDEVSTAKPGPAAPTPTPSDGAADAPSRDPEPASESAAMLFEPPNFANDQIKQFVAGVRPYRTGRVRIETETHGAKRIIHNYGHGGAGVTLSWGSAEEAVRQLRLLRDETTETAPVAVLGAGVIGLSTAHEVVSRTGRPVTVYAGAFTPNTTSDVAGAQWAPSLVAMGSPADDPGRFERILRASYRRFRALLAHPDWGVVERPNLQHGAGGDGLRHIPRDLLPEVRHVDPLPIRGLQKPGRIYDTLLIEPPVYLPRLMTELALLGVQFVERTFQSMDEVESLDEPIVMNCLGLGARAITDDSRLIPMRGQLVHLQPQHLPYLLSHDDGYVFPRRDAVVLGGTMERGVDDPLPRESSCLRILERNRRFFA